MIDNSELNGLKEKLAGLRASYEKLVSEKDEAKRKAVNEVESRLGPALNKAANECWKADEELKVARESFAAENPPYPKGTKFYRWYRGAGESAEKYSLAGESAVLELYTLALSYENTLYMPRAKFASPDRSNLPARGEWFLRMLKNDGKPGRYFERSSSPTGKFGGWYPEGVDPNTDPNGYLITGGL